MKSRRAELASGLPESLVESKWSREATLWPARWPSASASLAPASASGSRSPLAALAKTGARRLTTWVARVVAATGSMGHLRDNAVAPGERCSRRRDLRGQVALGDGD